MHPFRIFLAASFLFQSSEQTPVSNAERGLQVPLADLAVTHTESTTSQTLHGRFLHITDLHPDAFYKVHSSTEEEDACHRGKGTSGTYGAETSDCDTPFALINATFKWIEENIKDDIDFVVWTGDSARHDSDEKIPRKADEVLDTNRWIAEKFAEVFSKADDPKNTLTIPIIPTFGNNDILPHNILLSGPNKWLKTYTDVWSKFIPEEQRHGFERGGWFYVEVIPQKLAVFSLNTLYFFGNNAAVDGCALRSEPGYEHMEWLRIQLQFMRERGMKAILTGHIPPARTESKQLWDETCWQKYTLWLQQFRDVVVGGLYGHMNIDHFMLQDTKKVNLLEEESQASETSIIRTTMDEKLSVKSANDYLEELRADWSDLPNPKLGAKVNSQRPDESSKKKKGKKEKKRKKALKKMGGPWGERFHVTLVSPSIVPNFFPTLRVIEYNITSLDRTAIWSNPTSWVNNEQQFSPRSNKDPPKESAPEPEKVSGDDDISTDKKKKKKKGRKKKPTNPDLIVPEPPSKKSPPGPAYSPQPLTMTGYTQYFANLTYINNDSFVKPDGLEDLRGDVNSAKWHEGKHKGKHPKDKVPSPNAFQYQVEYDTFTDSIYKLEDMTVKSYIKLAHRIGQYKPVKSDQLDTLWDEVPSQDKDDHDSEDDSGDLDNDDVDDGDEDNHYESGKDKKKHKKKHKKKKKHHKQHEKNKVWLQFVSRAFVGTLEEEELHTFEPIAAEAVVPKDPRVESLPIDFRDGEL